MLLHRSLFILNFIFLILSVGCFSQNTISGVIIDQATLEGLAFVEIISASNSRKTTTNSEGYFEVSEEGSYTFTKEGYLSKTLFLKFNQNYKIKLESNPSKLNEIIINVNQTSGLIRKKQTSLNIISKKDIERFNNLNFAQAFNNTPGVFMQSGAINTNRITIRGIGSRNLFGTSKLRAYFGDIPLTNGSGETNIEDFELGSISSIRIIKGATPRIYGAGLGGVILLKSEENLNESNHISSEFSIGSYGLYKGLLQFNSSLKNNHFNVVYSNTEREGYRENNEYSRQTFTLNSKHTLNSNNELSFLMSYVNLKAFIPSSLNENTYQDSPKSAAFTWKESEGFEDTKRGVFGLTWNLRYKQNLNQITSVYTTFRDAYEPRPFNILEENTFALGLRSRLIGNLNFLDRKLDWSLGGEFFNDFHKYKTYENLYQEFPSGTGSIEGDLLSDFKEDRHYYNLFLDMNLELSSKLNISLGLNLNRTAYELDDQFTVSAENPDQSGFFKFKPIFSPKLGFSYLILENINLFSNVSHGFSPISLNETLLPDGQINPSLKPETGWTYEFGSNGKLLKNKIGYEISFYRMNIKNLLVSRRVNEDQFVGINAGKTRHDGLELNLNYIWLNNRKVNISSFVNYTLNNFKFEEFVDGENDYSGNDLTGVPSNLLNIGLDFDSRFGLYGNLNHQFVDSMPITDNNTFYSDSYNIFNLKIGYSLQLRNFLKIESFIGLNNIFNKKYASQILINATGFNGSAPRYFYPGEPTNYYAGLNLNYNF